MQSAASRGLESYNEPTGLHRGDMCSCKMKFQLHWEHGWPEAQLSHFLKRHFLHSSAILLWARQQLHSLVCLIPVPALLPAPSQQLGALFALLFLVSVELRQRIPLLPADTHQFYGRINLCGEIAPTFCTHYYEANTLQVQYFMPEVLCWLPVKCMEDNSKESLQQFRSSSRSGDTLHISCCPVGLRHITNFLLLFKGFFSAAVITE